MRNVPETLAYSTAVNTASTRRIMPQLDDNNSAYREINPSGTHAGNAAPFTLAQGMNCESLIACLTNVR